MTNKLKITMAAALMVAGIASPALAQSADHTGSQMPYYYNSTGSQMRGSWGPAAARFTRPVAQQNGLNAFAMVPGGSSNTYSPQATGGGSFGYNENLRND
jgi:hypothetical protein